MTALLPREIVAELDRFIIGQQDAKRAVAIALRNRWRRQQLPESLRDEVLPKNILMIGPTGCGKTEIARRLAKLADAPFVKVEATKFTEVGYVGRDVDSIIRDLIEVSMKQTRERMRREVKERASAAAEDRVLNALVGETASPETRAKFRAMLRAGELDDREIDIQINDTTGLSLPMMDIPGMPPGQSGQMGMLDLSEMLGKAFGGRKRHKKTTVRDSHALLMAEESDRLLDDDKVKSAALTAAEQQGIVFLDEIDKITSRSDDRRGGDVSREGVQRDLLPLIEGSSVSTKYGMVRTDHILFIASGAFHLAKPSDLLPELQGRLPIRVELAALTAKDFERILEETENSLLKQYRALMATEGLELTFTPAAVRAIAALAAEINGNVENIGARRLHTVLERLLEEISFAAGDATQNKGEKNIVIDERLVETRIAPLVKNADLSKFIL